MHGGCVDISRSHCHLPGKLVCYPDSDNYVAGDCVTLAGQNMQDRLRVEHRANIPAILKKTHCYISREL